MPLPMSKQSYLNELATELLLFIYNHLPKVSQVLFALVSKRMLTIFGDGHLPNASKELEFDERQSVLLALERQWPDLIYCHDCARPRNVAYDDESHSAALWAQTIAHTDCPGTYRGEHFVNEYFINWEFPRSYFREKATYRNHCDAWVLDPSRLVISFFEAHAVMHRHQHGPPYGLPLGGLRSSFSFERWLPLDHGNFHECNHWPLTEHDPQKQPLTRLARQRICDRSRLQLPHTRVRRMPSRMRPALEKLNEDSRRRPNVPYNHRMRNRGDASVINRTPRPTPGIPPSATLYPWQFHHDFDASVLKDQLYIRRSHRVTCTVDGDQRIEVRALYRLRLPICDHICSYVSPVTDPRGNLMLEIINRGLSILAPELVCLGEEHKVRHETLRSCAKCYTDYRLSLDWGYDGLHVAELTTYHRLGPCRTVNERARQSLFHWDGPLRIEDWRKFGPGTVFFRWERAHGNVQAKEDLARRQIIPRWSTPLYDRLYNPRRNVEAESLQQQSPPTQRDISPSSDQELPLCLCGRRHMCEQTHMEHHQSCSWRFGCGGLHPEVLWPRRLRTLGVRIRRDPPEAESRRRHQDRPISTILIRAVFSDEDREDKFARVTRHWPYKRNVVPPRYPSLSEDRWDQGWLESTAERECIVHVPTVNGPEGM